MFHHPMYSLEEIYCVGSCVQFREKPLKTKETELMLVNDNKNSQVKERKNLQSLQAREILEGLR